MFEPTMHLRVVKWFLKDPHGYHWPQENRIQQKWVNATTKEEQWRELPQITVVPE